MTTTTSDPSPLVIGTGPHTVLCLHGWFGDSAGWGRDFTSLLDTGTYRYVFVDARGYGARMEVTGDHTIEETALDAIAVADGLGAERFSLVGHSMGGSAVQRVLALAPDRVDAVVGISPVPASGVPFDDEGWALFDGAAQNDANRAAIIDLTTGNRLSARWVDSMVQYSVAHSTREAFGGHLEAWAKTDHSADVPAGRARTLAIVGEHDPALGEETIRNTWMLLHTESRLEVLANAGHYGMFETPVRLVTVLEEFLAG